MATIIPGWNPSPQRQLLAPATLNSITQVLSSTSLAATINFPASIAAGDLIVLLDSARSSFATPADATPSGFTRIGTSVTVAAASPTFVGTRSNLWYKLAAGTETGALTGMTGTSTIMKSMVVFRGNIAAITLTLGGAGQAGSDANPTALTCAANGGTPPLVVIGGYHSTGAVSPRTFSTTADGEVNPNTSQYLAWKIYNSAPASTSIDIDDEGNCNIIHAGYVQMA
jgi:hypothetical protein